MGREQPDPPPCSGGQGSGGRGLKRGHSSPHTQLCQERGQGKRDDRLFTALPSSFPL